MKWYKEKTLKFTIIAIFALGALLSIGTSIVDGEFNPIGGWFWLFAIVVVLPMAYFLRKKP